MIDVIKELKKVTLDKIENKKVVLMNKSLGETGTIVDVHFYSEKIDGKEIKSISHFDIKPDEIKDIKLQKVYTQMFFGKDFLPIQNNYTKVSIDTNLIKQDKLNELLFLLNQNMTIEKINNVFNNHKVFAIANNFHNKDLHNNSIDYILVSKSNVFNEISSTIKIPTDIISNIEDIKNNTLILPNEDFITENFNEFNHIFNEEMIREKNFNDIQ